ncbi:MAG: hypothetical protein WCF98_02625 [Synechococcus sp. ELA057]|jgi:hypothetical protein
MTPFSDRVVIVSLICTVALVFALVFWSARLNPAPSAPLQWREGPSAPSTSKSLI